MMITGSKRKSTMLNMSPGATKRMVPVTSRIQAIVLAKYSGRSLDMANAVESPSPGFPPLRISDVNFTANPLATALKGPITTTSRKRVCAR